jgi:hypothetical protein
MEEQFAASTEVPSSCLSNCSSRATSYSIRYFTFTTDASYAFKADLDVAFSASNQDASFGASVQLVDLTMFDDVFNYWNVSSAGSEFRTGVLPAGSYQLIMNFNSSIYRYPSNSGQITSATDINFNFDLLPPAPVPLPAGLWLLASGVGGLALFRRRRIEALAS